MSARHASRVPVYYPPSGTLNGQPIFPASPPHRTSPTFAAILVAALWAVNLQQDNISAGIVLTGTLTWLAVREHFRKAGVIVPSLLPPRPPEPLILSYPPSGQESDAKRRQAELWRNATRF